MLVISCSSLIPNDFPVAFQVPLTMSNSLTLMEHLSIRSYFGTYINQVNLVSYTIAPKISMQFLILKNPRKATAFLSLST